MIKPNFATMTKTEIRAYILEHRDDQEAVQAFFDKIYADDPNPKYYGPDDNISEIISEYIEKKRQQGSL